MAKRPLYLAAGILLLSACEAPAGELDTGPRSETGPSDAGPNDTGTDDAETSDAGPLELEPDTDLGDPAMETWIFMQSHLHTTGFHACANAPLDPGTGPESACYSAEGITAFLDDALVHGASDMIITDHNNIDAWFDPAFRPRADTGMTRYATPLRGTEWSSGDGHMTLLFPNEAASDGAAALANGWIFGAGNEAPVTDPGEYARVIASVHAAGGAVMINHPELAIHVFPESTFGADGVEVGIPPNPLDDVGGGAVSFHSSAEARRWWQRRLVMGDRLAGTAGADHHHGGGDIPGLESPTFGIAVNLIRIDPALPSTPDVLAAIDDPETTIDQRSEIVIDAVRRGHVMVVEDRDAARVFMGADGDGDGRFHDARPGDCLLPGDVASGEIRVRIRVTNPSEATGSSHYNLEFWDHSDAADPAFFVEVDYDTGFELDARYEIDPSDPFSIEMNLPYSPSEQRFLRVVLVRDVLGPVNDTIAVVNPIYYGSWGDECASARPLY